MLFAAQESEISMLAPNDVLSQAARHYSLGEFPLAERLTLEVLRANPTHSEAWRLLGGLAFKRNDPGRGFECLKRSLDCDPNNFQAWLTLSDCYRFAGDLKSALKTCERAAQRFPDSVDVHACLASLHRMLRSRKALASYEKVAKLSPENVNMTYRLADYLQEIGELDRAVGLYRQILLANPRHATVAAQLGRALCEQGYFEEAVPQLRSALTLNPIQPNTYYILSQLAADGWCELTPGEIEQIGALAANPQLHDKDRADAAFALANTCAKQDAFDDAMNAYHLANACARQNYFKGNLAFESRRHDEMVDHIISIYNQAYFDAVREWGVPSQVPVFIVGMPRSGSTLVEQVLANHPQVFGLNEIGDMRSFVGKFEGTLAPDRYSVPTVRSASVAHEMATAYLEWMREFGSDAALIINKSLENFLYLGMIATLFPKARIIHCQRDPLDVCLACYFMNFRFMPFSCALEDIGVYHRSYERLMDHWKRALPIPIHHVRYESLIDQPKSAINDLLAFCGLEWDERCLEFHKSHRVVNTASAAQVRKPIYKNAVGRSWKYREHLGPLMAALGMPASDKTNAES